MFSWLGRLIRRGSPWRILLSPGGHEPSYPHLEAQGKGSLLLSQYDFSHPYLFPHQSQVDPAVWGATGFELRPTLLESPCTSYVDWGSLEEVPDDASCIPRGWRGFCCLMAWSQDPLNRMKEGMDEGGG